MIKDSIYLILYLATEFINYLLAYVIIFQMPISKRKRNWVIGIGLILLTHFGVLYYLGVENALGISAATMLVIPMLLTDRKKIKSIVLYPFIFMGLSVFIVNMSFILAVGFDINEHVIVEKQYMVLICQSIPSIILFLAHVWRKKKGFEKINIHLGFQQYILFYVTAVCTFLMLAPMQAISNGDTSKETINICGLAMSIASIVFITLVLWHGIIVHREVQLKERNKATEEYMKMQEEYFQQTIKQDEKMRRFRHDMNAHLAVLKTYSENGDAKGIKEYLDDVIRESAIYDLKSYTGNCGIDAVIRELISRAKRNQIDVEIKGTLPQITKITVYDLCTILSNLMSNAIEACEKIDNTRERKVEVEIGSYNSQIFLTVKNRIASEIEMRDGHLITSKEDVENHGLGSGNVEKAVRKYDGYIEYQNESEWFSVTMVIND